LGGGVRDATHHANVPTAASNKTGRNICNKFRFGGYRVFVNDKIQRNAYRILVGNPEGKRPLGRPRRRWVDNIKIDLREIGWDGRDWIELAQDRD
jgi:hypothetical protein